MNNIETRLAELEAAYRETLARTLALETVCLAMLPTICPGDEQTEAILQAAEVALDQTLENDGVDDGFRRSAVMWFRRMRMDAVFPGEDSRCH